MRSWVAILVAAFAVPAWASWEPEETAVAAFVNLARTDLDDTCALCKRIDSGTDCSDWGAARVHGVLRYVPVAADASRFHSRHMHDAPCFQHDSCCDLERTAAGVVQCANAPCSECAFPSECPGTGPQERYGLLGYGVPSLGENIAAGYPRAPEVFCGWMNSDGHRENILGDYDEIGVGKYSAASSCQDPFWSQVFGGSQVTRDPGYLAAAGAFPGGAPFGSGLASVSVVAFTHEATAAAKPSSVRAVIDGQCSDLAQVEGSGLGALHAASLNVADGCHDLWFLAVDAAGKRHVFPPTSSMALRVGTGTCPAPTARTPAACEGPLACSIEGAHQACYGGPDGTEGVGACHGGSQECEAGAYAECTGAVVPAPEKCNGLDDDCDGEIDETPSDQGDSCTTNLPGVCSAGVTTCAGGTLVCVPVSQPSDETCNGRDDDCDGEIDDGLGQITCGEGACRRVVKACDDGSPAACVPGTPATEVCANGLDDDCDGAADDGCPCSGSSRACYAGPAGTVDKGACRAGLQQCSAGAWGPCDGQVLPTSESCNGEDDDCNEATDDGLGRTACGSGGCRVITANCLSGAPRACSPAAPRSELCDGVDDDCDGEVDEGCRCRSGASVACSADWDVAKVGRCRAGASTCEGGGQAFGACVGEIGPIEEVCGNGLDDDCDGFADDGCPEPVLPAVPAATHRGCGCDNSGFSALFALPAVLLRRRPARR